MLQGQLSARSVRRLQLRPHQVHGPCRLVGGGLRRRWRSSEAGVGWEGGPLSGGDWVSWERCSGGPAQQGERRMRAAWQARAPPGRLAPPAPQHATDAQWQAAHPHLLACAVLQIGLPLALPCIRHAGVLPSQRLQQQGGVERSGAKERRITALSRAAAAAAAAAAATATGCLSPAARNAGARVWLAMQAGRAAGSARRGLRLLYRHSPSAPPGRPGASRPASYSWCLHKALGGKSGLRGCEPAGSTCFEHCV